jgi:hypothetical protein
MEEDLCLVLITQLRSSSLSSPSQSCLRNFFLIVRSVSIGDMHDSL